MTAAGLLDGLAEALRLGLSETLAGPEAVPPGELAAVCVAAAWIAWVDRRHGIIPDLALGLLAGLAAARLAPFGGGAVAGGAAVGLAVLGVLHALSRIASRAGLVPLGAGDARFIAAVTVFLGLSGLVVTLAVSAALLAADSLRRVRAAGRPLVDALAIPIRMGPHLALGFLGAVSAAAVRW